MYAGVDEERYAETDRERVDVFTDTWRNISRISDEENRGYDGGTETMVREELERNVERLTPKEVIDLVA